MTTRAPTTMTYINSYLLGAILAYVPGGHATLKSVLTTALPPAGTTVFSALERSNPAESGAPRVGMVAVSERNLTCRQEDGLSDDDDMADMNIGEEVSSNEEDGRRVAASAV